MPKSKKKKFIDKKNSVTFHLVHRSQQDPLIADEEAPQHVLLKADNKNFKELNEEKRLEEQRKYGIYKEDDYDYLQHLRDVNYDKAMFWEKIENVNQKSSKNDKIKNLNLPSCVFPSEQEEEVGLLNKAAPQGLCLDFDPDIVAAMDDDFNYNDPDNLLPDNFIELANGDIRDFFDEEYEDYEENEDTDLNTDSCAAVSAHSSNYSSEEEDEVGSLKSFDEDFKRNVKFQDDFDDGKGSVKSRFTDYSMSSSVIKRNEQLTLLDERFEQMYIDYDENELGALDMDEIEGHLDMKHQNHILLECAKDFEDKQTRKKLDSLGQFNDNNINEDDFSSNSNESDNELVDFDITNSREEKWDCQSILSTYSNIYNHPKLISEPNINKKIRINQKTGIPFSDSIAVTPINKLTVKSLAQFNLENDRSNNDNNLQDDDDQTFAGKSILSTISQISIRSKNETPEQRRERKKALKLLRKDRRTEKKLNQLAFKDEKKRQEKIMLNNKFNVPASKIV